MTLIPLTYKNFVKNKVKNTLKVKYKNSDETTFISDNSINSKSILNTSAYTDLNHIDLNVSASDANLSTKKNAAFDFFNDLNNKFGSDYFTLKDSIQSNGNLTNDNLKLYNFKNNFKINRVEQRFLPQSFELQKKNYVKNLYKEYQKDFKLDFYNNLDFGFCNWNTINFFSQRYESDRNHTNCIVWPNSKLTSTNQYDFVNNNFNVSFYFNLRKNYHTSSNPECIFHIPDLISLYIIRNKSNTSHKIGITLGRKSKIKLVDVTGYNANSDSEQLLSSSEAYVSSDLNILNNRWYNLSLNFNKNGSNSRNLEVFIDGVSKFSKDLTINKDNNSVFNSYICIGNRPEYASNTNYEHVFYQLFARIFDKDISLGKNNTWTDDGNLDATDNSYTGNVIFEKSVTQSSESFHGEIHDIRIHKDTLSEDTILNNCTNVINNINDEIINNKLDFYVPVYYVPSFSNRKGSFNASGTKLNLRYNSLYNPILANTCGGLEVSSENYLIDFVNHSKPNVIIGGAIASYLYDDNITNSIDSMINSTSDVLKIKTGHFVQSIYNSNINNSSHNNRSLNLDSNLSYRNLMILPNDNGIQKVNFDVIKEFLTNYNSSYYENNIINENKLYFIDIENLFNKEYYNKSWNLNITESDNIPNHLTLNNKFMTSFSNNSSNISLRSSKSNIFNLSNIIFHDDRITNISDLSTLTNTSVTSLFTKEENLKQIAKEIYPITESNPLLRNIKQPTSSTLLNNSMLLDSKFTLEYKSQDISFIRQPMPYSVFNFDYDSIFISIFDISSKLYNNKINKNTFSLEDSNISTSNNNLNIKLKDNSNGTLYRSNCLTKVADWNFVGHLFYKEGIISLNRPELYYFGKEDFECNFESDFMMYVNEVNIPADKGLFDISSNTTHNKDLRQDESAFNSEDSFVYITDINIHDENLNIVARARLARPAPKKKSDSILFRLKMDY